MKYLIAAAAAMAMAGAAHADHHGKKGDPETDMHGHKVYSMKAETPAGANKTWTAADGKRYVVNPNQEAVFAQKQGEADLPPCSAERTDRCVQTYTPSY